MKYGSNEFIYTWKTHLNKNKIIYVSYCNAQTLLCDHRNNTIEVAN